MSRILLDFVGGCDTMDEPGKGVHCFHHNITTFFEREGQ